MSPPLPPRPATERGDSVRAAWSGTRGAVTLQRAEGVTRPLLGDPPPVVVPWRRRLRRHREVRGRRGGRSEADVRRAAEHADARRWVRSGARRCSGAEGAQRQATTTAAVAGRGAGAFPFPDPVVDDLICSEAQG
uniref:Uncharacterized protein n=1 Tax=Arundo donax TaxID=35708 RepID=A0A0A8YM76_ARUDO